MLTLKRVRLNVWGVRKKLAKERGNEKVEWRAVEEVLGFGLSEKLVDIIGCN